MGAIGRSFQVGYDEDNPPRPFNPLITEVRLDYLTYRASRTLTHEGDSHTPDNGNLIVTHFPGGQVHPAFIDVEDERGHTVEDLYVGGTNTVQQLAQRYTLGALPTDDPVEIVGAIPYSPFYPKTTEQLTPHPEVTGLDLMTNENVHVPFDDVFTNDFYVLTHTISVSHSSLATVSVDNNHNRFSIRAKGSAGDGTITYTAEYFAQFESQTFHLRVRDEVL